MEVLLGYQPEYVETKVVFDSEEILCCIEEHLTKHPGDPRVFARLLTDYHQFLETTPDSVLVLIGARARQITVDILRKQADRIAAIES